MKIHACIECFRKLKTVNAELMFCPNEACKRHGLVTVASRVTEVKDERERVNR